MTRPFGWSILLESSGADLKIVGACTSNGPGDFFDPADGFI